MKVVKQRFTRQVRRDTASDSVCQKRFYDFNVWSDRKRIDKLRYIHRNPVKRGLVEQPEQWKCGGLLHLQGGTKGKRVGRHERKYWRL